jgi:uncharacterized membrane protein YfcA
VTPGQTALLAAIVTVAFFVEAAAGFGSIVVALTIGALFFPMPSLLGWLVPVNLVLSGYLVARGVKRLDWKFLLSSVVPLMTVGLVAGMWLARATDTAWLKPVFAVFVVAVAAHQLASTTAPVPLSRPVASAVLLAAGVVHGVFATGGPLTVFVASRTLPDKTAFRATLAVVWVVLNLLLLPRLWLGPRFRSRHCCWFRWRWESSRESGCTTGSLKSASGGSSRCCCWSPVAPCSSRP